SFPWSVAAVSSSSCIAVSLCVLALASSAASAQAGTSDPTIPEAYMPPAGMCRIWVQGVPANKQPAPTDCATAIKNNPANGRVIFGPTKDSTRVGGVSQLLRGRGLLPVGPLRGNPAQARALVNPS